MGNNTSSPQNFKGPTSYFSLGKPSENKRKHCQNPNLDFSYVFKDNGVASAIKESAKYPMTHSSSFSARYENRALTT